MNTIELNENVNQYFEYIKSIYLTEFDRYLSRDVKNDIVNIKNAIELRDEMSYKIHVHDDKITFNLDIKKFIEENDLKNEKSLLDLNNNSKKYVKYILDNEENVFEIIKDNLLKSIVLLFTKNRKDVVTLGTVEIISSNLAQKYNLPNLNIIPSKELEIAKEIGNIIGNDILICGVVNRDYEMLEKEFNSFSKKTSYKEFTKKINNTYESFRKKIGKIYLTDSLYEYDQMNYKIDDVLKDAKEEKNNDEKNKLARLKSIKMSIGNMYTHKILYTVLEQRKLESAYNIINDILKRIISDSNRAVDLIDLEYDKILAIEEELKDLTNPIWHNFLTKPSEADNQYFNYLVSTNINENYIEAKLISSEVINKINNLDLKYGFICNPKDNAIIHTSSKSFNYKIEDDKCIVDNKTDSYLQTPGMIISSNIKKQKLSNEILLDKNKVYISGVFCIVDDELDNCPNYLKASVLAEDNNLPLIMFDVNELDKVSQR